MTQKNNNTAANLPQDPVSSSIHELEGISVSVRDLELNFGQIPIFKKLNLDVYRGEFLVLLGSSGCGKSTLLNCIAGLADISDGQIWVEGKNVTWADPSKRGIGMVFQSYALYPQMSVYGNLSFGLRNTGVGKSEVARRVENVAKILHLESLLERKPAALSGGQRQRVAIGRALVREVDVFLFDEPLSNLDAQLRAELRIELKRLHQRLKNTMIYVTHDQIEAMTLADRVAIMRNGIIQQIASPLEIYHRPINQYVAGFIGAPPMNFVSGILEKQTFCAAFSADMGNYHFNNESKNYAGEAVFGIRPEHITVGESAKSMPVCFEVTADVVEPLGADLLVWTAVGQETFCIRLDGQMQVQSGDVLVVGMDPARASLFDKVSGKRL